MEVIKISYKDNSFVSKAVNGFYNCEEIHWSDGHVDKYSTSPNNRSSKIIGGQNLDAEHVYCYVYDPYTKNYHGYWYNPHIKDEKNEKECVFLGSISDIAKYELIAKPDDFYGHSRETYYKFKLRNIETNELIRVFTSPAMLAERLGIPISEILSEVESER